MKKVATNLILLGILFSLLFCVNNYAQMPPHPSLLEKISKGEIQKPYTLANLELIRSKGIDQPWSSPKLQMLKKQNGFTRSFGIETAPAGSWKALAILVQFSDKVAQVTASYFDNLLFGQSTGTLRDYYDKVSYGNLDVVTVNLPSSMGWTTAPQTYAYYVNGQNGMGSYPQNSQKLTEDIVNLVNPIIDFSQYDNDGDGYVDALFIIHSGTGAEYTGNDNDIWSHAWTTKTPQILDGVNVYRYSTEPEYWQTPGDMTCGVYAHEMGHAAFGLPDLYDTDNTSYGLGRWSLMAGGSWNGTLGSSPAFPDAWSHFQMDYLSPTVISADISSQLINNIESVPDAYLLYNDNCGSEYFLIENRQQTGYDTYLPGNGLCIYHVDNSVNNNNNEWYPGHTSSGHYHIALEQADGLWNLEHKNNQGDIGDPYPGSSNNTSFSSSTIPDNKNYNFIETGIEVSNISSSSTSMYANLKVGAFPTSQFSEQVLISLIGVSGSSAWGDYDNDGYLDILLTGRIDGFDNKVSKIYHNNGNNTFTEQTSISLTNVSTGSAEWGDYDNDGDLDILLTGSTNIEKISKIYRNNGNNTFTEQTSIALTGVFNSYAAWGDYDNDGDLDLILTGSIGFVPGANTFDVSKIYRNNGGNTFTEQTSINLVGVENGRAAWGDYDNDGDLDILLSGENVSSTSEIPVTKIYRNNGDNTFSDQTSIPLAQCSGTCAWGDYDNDGDLDILLSGRLIEYNHRVSKIYRNDGNNTFTEQTEIPIVGLESSSVSWGDYDSDGDLDILISGYTGSEGLTKIYQNDGNGQFTEQTISLSGTYGRSSSKWVDYDNDGDLDILLIGWDNNLNIVSKIYRNNSTTPNLPPSAPSNLQTTVNGHDVTFSWDKSTDNETPQNGLHYNLAIGSTSNGVDKLSPMADRSSGFRRVVRLGNSQTNSWTIKDLPVGQYYWSVQAIDNAFTGSNFAATQTFPVGNVFAQFTEQTDISLPGVSASSAAWGDYDNDGDLDIVLTGYVGGNLVSKIYRNEGNNIFTEQSDISLVGGSPVCWGDYDNDGYLDIFLNNRIYHNNGNNTFTEKASIPDIGVSSAAWGDYDNDGDLDILVTGWAGMDTYVSKIYRNDGEGTFTDQTSIHLRGVGLSSVAWGDYDNDGDLDILLVGQYRESYRLIQVSKIYRNNGDNTFTDLSSTIHITSGVYEGSVAWADYDDDGDLDILLAGGGHFEINRNDGNNVFTKISIPLLIGNCSAVWGDYDNDGDLDILITGFTDEPISKIYRNDGDDTFTEQTSISLTGISGGSALWGDYDNDGDLDILLAGSGLSKIYRNNNPISNTVPSSPSNLQAVINGNDVTFSWDKSTDNETPQNGLHYNLVIGTEVYGVDKLSPMSDRSTGYRRVVRLGNTQTNSWTIKNNTLVGHYYWSVQAVDNCFAGSEFASEQDVPLPVELTSFTVEKSDYSVKLVWQTATEINNFGFEIERRTDENNKWEDLGFVQGNGNSNSPKNYVYVDKQPLGGSKFTYRLKQIDNDGSFKYSESVEVIILPTVFELYQNYPNPFNPTTKIRYTIPNNVILSEANNLVTLKIYDVLGNEIATLVNENKPAGSYEVEFNGGKLSSGVYYYQLKSGSYLETKKMILLR